MELNLLVHTRKTWADLHSSLVTHHRGIHVIMLLLNYCTMHLYWVHFSLLCLYPKSLCLICLVLMCNIKPQKDSEMTDNNRAQLGAKWWLRNLPSALAEKTLAKPTPPSTQGSPRDPGLIHSPTDHQLQIFQPYIGLQCFVGATSPVVRFSGCVSSISLSLGWLSLQILMMDLMPSRGKLWPHSLKRLYSGTWRRFTRIIQTPEMREELKVSFTFSYKYNLFLLWCVTCLHVIFRLHISGVHSLKDLIETY